MLVGPYVSWLTDTVAAVGAALAGAGRPAGRLQVVVATAAFDDCCQGQVWGALERAYPSVAFPAQESGLRSQCMVPPIGVPWVVGLARCVRTVQEVNGRVIVPSAAQVTDDALAFYDDVDLVTGVVVARMRTAVEWVYGGVTFREPAGGCVAAEWRGTLGDLG